MSEAVLDRQSVGGVTVTLMHFWPDAEVSGVSEVWKVITAWPAREKETRRFTSAVKAKDYFDARLQTLRLRLQPMANPNEGPKEAA